MTEEWWIEAPLEPAACARPRATRAGRTVRVYTPTETLRWQAMLAHHAQLVLRGKRFDGPVALDLVAVLTRPKRLDTRTQHPGAQWAPARPDLDNIAKNVLDALRFAWRDDAQVTWLRAAKLYAARGSGARVVVRIEELATQPALLLRAQGMMTASMEEAEKLNEHLTPDTKEREKRGARGARKRGENDE